MNCTQGTSAVGLNREDMLKEPAAGPKQARWKRRGWALGAAVSLLLATDAQAQFGSQPVGVVSGAQGVTVTSVATGTVSSAKVLTLGASGLEFSQGAGASTCGTAIFAAAGQTCTESVTFSPTVPGLRIGAVVLLDGIGNVLGSTYISGSGTGGLGVLAPGNLIQVAGNGTYLGSVQDGNPATDAPFTFEREDAGHMIGFDGRRVVRDLTAVKWPPT